MVSSVTDSCVGGGGGVGVGLDILIIVEFAV